MSSCFGVDLPLHPLSPKKRTSRDAHRRADTFLFERFFNCISIFYRKPYCAGNKRSFPAYRFVGPLQEGVRTLYNICNEQSIENHLSVPSSLCMFFKGSSEECFLRDLVGNKGNRAS